MTPREILECIRDHGIDRETRDKNKRYTFDRLWRDGEWACATDGVIAVRAPAAAFSEAMPGTAAEQGVTFPPVADLFAASMKLGVPVELPTMNAAVLTEPWKGMKCGPDGAFDLGVIYVRMLRSFGADRVWGTVNATICRWEVDCGGVIVEGLLKMREP